MLDFLIISTRTRKGVVEVYPKFKITSRSKDLMTRGGDFYAIWIKQLGLWSTNEDDALVLIDGYLEEFAQTNKHRFGEDNVRIMYMWDAETGMIDIWHKYCQKQMRTNWKQLDENLIFMNQVANKEDYGTKRLNYSIDENGSMESWEELVSTLYKPNDRHKIEWCIGAVLTGDSKWIQKFAVFYGAPGTGKSTILNIVESLFKGYTKMFDPATLGSRSPFALSQFKSNPLVAVSHDGDLSRIEQNTNINSLVSHEKMVVNEKHKAMYEMRFRTFLMMGTNSPVKITDGKSGLLRRLIDIYPSGNKIPLPKYNRLVTQINFELGAIAYHCIGVYESNKRAYDDYRPTLMISESNDFYNFVADSYMIFKKDDSTTLKIAWEMYKIYCDSARVPYPLPMRMFKNELRNYFKNYSERIRIDGQYVRSYYSEFISDIFDIKEPNIKPKNKKAKDSFDLISLGKHDESFLDIYAADCAAQYGTRSGIPTRKWADCDTTLKDLDTSRLHYLKVPENHIVIDFDIQGDDGKKDFQKNLEEASKWPRTYTEVSKSGGGIHLHYIYEGDPTTLSRVYADNIEIKVFAGNSSLRRKLTLCNTEEINTINSGLPLREVGRVINFKSVKNEKAIRSLIKNNLNKNYHPGTKPSMDFIFKILDDAYKSGVKYDVNDLHGAILSFAASSTNHSDYCIKLLPKMKFKSDEASSSVENDEKPIAFYDVEVFPNLLVVNWKLAGNGRPVNRMINPTQQEIGNLMEYRLIGFNCRRYDNHIIYGTYIGYSNIQLYNLSKRIINDKNGFFGEAYNISYTDIYDYTRDKMSLKKWQIKLKIKHKELGLPWDQPVPEERWIEVAEYCDNDVIATEAVWDYTQGDFRARQMLVALVKNFRKINVSVNDTTNSLTTKLIFGWERNPKLNYVDLSKEFPGYEFIKTWNDKTKRYDKFNMYRGIDLKFGGYVYAEPGMYTDVGLLDIKSMHPNSAIIMEYFGEYTSIYESIVIARVYIKEGNLEAAKELFDRVLEPFLDDPTLADDAAGALKIAINAVYGLTSARFKNPFKDPLNENNIVALRGALFMKTLQDALVERGVQVVHIKTDSIKIPNITKETIKFCHEMAAKYGYEFNHEATYDRICLVNDAVYIAKYDKHGMRDKGGKKANEWTATGTQFKVPYVFKTLFSKEAIDIDDLAEVKSVKSSIYLNMNEATGDDELKFIGRVGNFSPVVPGTGGGILVKPVQKNDGTVSYDAVTGTKGYRWLETEMVEELDLIESIDRSYYNKMVDGAISTINKFGDFEWFAS